MMLSAVVALLIVESVKPVMLASRAREGQHLPLGSAWRARLW